ncbi:MAG: hypothetical protein ACYCW6_30690 [Candidatus Xenobia bacterium]
MIHSVHAASRNVISPYKGITAAPAEPVASADRVEVAAAPAPRRSILTRVGAPLLMGAALLGAGTLAPTVASAQEWHGGPAIMYHREGGNFGAGLAAGILGGIIGGAIANSVAPPVYVAPPPVYYYNPGVNAFGCDGVVHHFDGRGNVADGSGYYRLFINGFGQCQAGPAW